MNTAAAIQDLYSGLEVAGEQTVALLLSCSQIIEAIEVDLAASLFPVPHACDPTPQAGSY